MLNSCVESCVESGGPARWTIAARTENLRAYATIQPAMGVTTVPAAGLATIAPHGARGLEITNSNLPTLLRTALLFAVFYAAVAVAQRDDAVARAASLHEQAVRLYDQGKLREA